MNNETFVFKLAQIPRSSGGVKYEARTPDGEQSLLDAYGRPWLVYVPQSFLPKPFPSEITLTLKYKPIFEEDV